MLTRSQTKNSSSSSNNKVFSNSNSSSNNRMVTRSQINMTIEEFPSPKDKVPSPKEKVHRPTTNNRKIIVDADDSAPRMVTRSMTLASQVKQAQEIDFDGASRAWRKANPNRQR